MSFLHRCSACDTLSRRGLSLSQSSSRPGNALICSGRWVRRLCPKSSRISDPQHFHTSCARGRAYTQTHTAWCCHMCTRSSACSVLTTNAPTVGTAVRLCRLRYNTRERRACSYFARAFGIAMSSVMPPKRLRGVGTVSTPTAHSTVPLHPPTQVHTTTHLRTRLEPGLGLKFRALAR